MKGRPLIIAVLLVSGILLLIFTANPRRIKPVAVGLYAPDFEVMDAKNGNRLLFSEIKGKVIFINFWASWCKPCREEMPSIEALYKEMSSNDDFRMITIIFNESTETALEYMRTNGYTFPVYSDPKSNASRTYGITGVPETYLVNKKGIVKERQIGPAEWNSVEKKDFIYSLLNE